MSMFCKIVGPSSDIHKLPEVPKAFKDLHAIVLKKFGHELPGKFSLKYKDSDEELITLSNDEDLQTAVVTCQSENVKTLRIFVIVDPNLSANKDIKTGDVPIQKSSPQQDTTTKNNVIEKGNFLDEPYVGQLDYISSDPGKIVDENAELKKLIDQLPSTLEFRRSMSHNPQPEIGGLNVNNGKSFGNREIYDGQPPRLGSPGLPEEISGNDYFNEEQMKLIVSVVEQKVTDKIEEKISNFSNEILAKFQEEIRSMGMGRGMNNFGAKGMGMPYGSRMSIRRNNQAQDDDLPKECSNCNQRISGIKYNCLTCRNFTCCETCESSINHEHPLLKIRPPRANDSSKADLNEEYSGFMNEMNSSGRIMNEMTSSGRFVAKPGSNMMQKMNTMAAINQHAPNTQTSNSRDIKKVNGDHMSTSASWATNTSHVDNSTTIPPVRFSTQNFENKSHTSTELGKQLFKSSTIEVQSPTHFVSPNLKNNLRTGEFKQYKVALVKPPLYEVTTVKAGNHYNINFTIKNNGDLPWPEGTKLLCVEGIHKGEDLSLPTLNPGASYIVDLHLQAPWELGRFFNEWKVHYPKDGGMKAFGKEISIEIEVVDGDKLEKERAKKEKEKEKIEKPVHVEKAREQRTGLNNDKLSDDDKKLMKEFDCSEMVLKNAKVLQDLMSTGSLKEKVDFVRSCNKDWSLNQIVSAYLNNPGKLKDTTPN